MIKISDLISYFPAKHGEHGVDATLHVLSSSSDYLHEVFSNPPGGSWTQFDVIRPETNITYRWDHIPRAPSADVKRPDLVLQLNEGKNMSFLSIESKLNKGAAEKDMPIRLERYFTGLNKFTGIMQRPAWHKFQGELSSPEVIEGGSPSSMEWEIIPPDAPEDERYWFDKYPREQIKFWAGFSYALNPEIYSTTEKINMDSIAEEIKSLQQKHSGLDVIIAIGWVGENQTPFIIKSYSEEFSKSNFCKNLDNVLEPAILD